MTSLPTVEHHNLELKNPGSNIRASFVTAKKGIIKKKRAGSQILGLVVTGSFLGSVRSFKKDETYSRIESLTPANGNGQESYFSILNTVIGGHG